MSSNYSDVTFVVDGEKIPAHRNILAVRSTYFSAMLYGKFSESTQSKIKLSVPLEAFKDIFKYLYSGFMPLSKMELSNILDVLDLVNEYHLQTLKLEISSFLMNKVSLQNCCDILHSAQLYGLEKLADVCMIFMERNLPDFLHSDGFGTLSQDLLCTFAGSGYVL